MLGLKSVLLNSDAHRPADHFEKVEPNVLLVDVLRRRDNVSSHSCQDQ